MATSTDVGCRRQAGISSEPKTLLMGETLENRTVIEFTWTNWNRDFVNNQLKQVNNFKIVIGLLTRASVSNRLIHHDLASDDPQYCLDEHTSVKAVKPCGHLHEYPRLEMQVAGRAVSGRREISSAICKTPVAFFNRHVGRKLERSEIDPLGKTKEFVLKQASDKKGQKPIRKRKKQKMIAIAEHSVAGCILQLKRSQWI